MALAGRLKPQEHARHPWRIEEVIPDFDLIDAWAVPAEGSATEFGEFCDVVASIDLKNETSTPSRLLFTAREQLGELLGWDNDTNTLAIPGCAEATLRDRLPSDLQAEDADTAGKLPFRPIYRTDNEWALEVSNKTVHAVVHFTWVPLTGDRFQGQLGIYVKPRGRLGAPYMTFIGPFRHHIVYPALLKQIGTAWERRSKIKAPEGSATRP